MDKNNWLERQSGNKYEEDKSEQQFRIDRGRLTNSSAFRRLQGKTQVMSVGEHDFFRSRLTHSIEVANIGISISRRIEERLRYSGKQELADLIPQQKWKVGPKRQ